MSKMRCQEAELLISCALDREAVPTGARQRLEAHLAVCGPCREARARGERLAAGLRAALRPTAAEGEQTRALAAQLASADLHGAPAPGRDAPWRLGWGGLVWPAAGLAAAALALFAVMPWRPAVPPGAMDQETPATADACRVFLELESRELSPMPAFDGKPVRRDVWRRGRFELPTYPRPSPGALAEPPDSQLEGLEKVDTRFIRLTSWPYQ